MLKIEVPNEKAVSSEPEKKLTEEEELRNIRIKKLLQKQDFEIFDKKTTKRASSKEPVKEATLKRVKKPKKTRKAKTKTKTKVKYLGKKKERVSDGKPESTERGGGRVDVIRIEDSAAVGEDKLGKKSRRTRRRPLEKLNILLEDLLTEEARINQEKLSSRRLGSRPRMQPRTAQVRANRFEFDDRLGVNFGLRKLELAFAMMALHLRVEQQRVECSWDARQLDISKNLFALVSRDAQPSRSDPLETPCDQQTKQATQESEVLLDCKLEAIFDDVFNEKRQADSSGAHTDDWEGGDPRRADNEPEEGHSPGNESRLSGRHKLDQENSLSRSLDLSQKLCLEQIQTELGKEGATLGLSLEKVESGFKLKFTVETSSEKQYLKLQLGAPSWVAALEFGKLRFASMIAPKYFRSLLRRSGFKSPIKSLQKFVADFCVSQNIQISQVTTLENLNKFLGKLNVGELGDLEREFKSQNYSKILKKIFRKGLRSKVDMLFEDVESEKTSPSESQKFKGMLVCSKRDIFQLECQTENLRVAKQVTCLVFLCTYFPSVPSFYIELETLHLMLQ